ncbi:MAG: PKD domain-containing protein, partial [Candidatus Thermoplasmatota archaeon]|nr:PKD domain-containing protein [Candidatus Thermoplasmatota archaeon]
GTVTLYGVSPEYTFSEPGIYEISMNVTDASGNWAKTIMVLTVNDVTSPFGELSNLVVDEDVIVLLNGSLLSDNVGIANWSWSLGSEKWYGVSREIAFSDPGVYNITLTVKDAAGNWKLGFLLVTVRDVTKPIVDAGSDQTIMEGTIVTLSGSGSDNVEIVNWTWAFNDGNGQVTLYGQNVAHNFSVPGKYTITLTVLDLAGNSESSTMKVNVEEIQEKPHDPSLGDYWWIALIVVVVLILAGIGFLFLWRRKPEEEIQEETPEEPDDPEGQPSNEDSPIPPELEPMVPVTQI